ncbi:hypothetical protein LPJ56_002908 [Coemansia sp. RSA 2599]|nr:hypothetical protein LPJ56_002908 [Coemansia sp. RSA 2599]
MLTSPLLRGGKWSLESRAFLCISAFQTILNVSFESYFISRLRNQPSISNQSYLYIVYDGGFLAAQIFAFLLTYSALQAKSEPLVTTSAAFDLLLLLFQVALLAQTGSLLGVVAIQAVSIAILTIGCMAKIVLIWKHLKKEFGWQVYRALGADLKMQRMFYFHQLLLALTVLASFFFLELWLQLATITAQSKGKQGGGWVQNIFILFICAVVLCMCLFAAVQEFLWLMYGCIGIFVISPAFFIYKLVAVTHKPAGGIEDVYKPGRTYMTFFLAVLLILDLALAAVSYIVARTFGKGLRQRLRHFQILARGEVDLETAHLSESNKSLEAHPDARNEQQINGVGSTAARGFSGIMTSAKSSLKESSLLLRAFFSGLDVERSHVPNSSMRSLHRESVALWEQASPGLINPKLVNMFDTQTSDTLNLSTSVSSPEQAYRSHIQSPSATTSALGSRLFDTNTHLGSKSSVQGTIALALSAAELDVINGKPMASDTFFSYTSVGSPDRAAASFSKAARPIESSPENAKTTMSSLPKSIATSATAKNASTSTSFGPLKTEIEDYATDCAIFNTIKQPQTLRVVNVDADSSIDDKGRKGCQSPDS